MEVARSRVSMATLKSDLQEIVGEPIDTVVVTVRTTGGEVLAVYPPAQDPRVTADLAADTAHGLNCPGCPDCR